MNQTKNNILATLCGLIIINCQTFGIYWLLANGHDTAALYVSLLGSFTLFMIFRLTNRFRIINRLLGLGIVCGFIGSFIVAELYLNYQNAALSYQGVQAFEVQNITEIDKYPDQKVFKVNQALPQFNFAYDYFHRLRNQHENYVIVPVVSSSTKPKDTLRYFAGFKYTDALFSNSKDELINFISSQKATVWRYRDTSHIKFLKKALLRSTSKNKYKLSQSPVFLEFRDMDAEIVNAKMKARNLFLAVNALWLLFCFFEANKKAKE